MRLSFFFLGRVLYFECFTIVFFISYMEFIVYISSLDLNAARPDDRFEHAWIYGINFAT